MAEPIGVTGISGALGFAPETTWGTSVAPTKWTEFMPGETVQRTQNFMRAQGLKAGRMFTTGSRTTPTTRTAGGAFSLEVPNQGFGAFLNLLHGETVTPKEEAEKAFKQVHKIGTTDPYKKSMTLVFGRPKVSGGTIDSYTYPGVIVNSMELTMATSGYLLAAVNVDAFDEITEGTGFQKIGTVAIPTGVESFNFTTAKLVVNSVEQKLAREVKITFAKPTDVSRFYLGSATRSQPLTNAFNTIKLDVVADYNDQTLYKMFAKNETQKVELAFVGGIAKGAEKFELKFVFPLARFEGDTPNIKDLGTLQQQIPLMVEDNGSEPPCTATYVSTDTEL